MKQQAPLSTVQYGIYAECVGHQGEICYNLPYIYVVDGMLDDNRLIAAVKSMLQAHPTLFTRIELNDNGEPVQTIDLENESVELKVERIADIEAEKARLVTPFNIYGDRLFHINLMTDGKRYYLFFDYHHIIVDGTTQQLLLHDVERAYQGEALEPEEVTLAQVAREDAARRLTPAFDEAKQWHAATFDCGDTYTPLMPDRYEEERSEASMVRVLEVSPERVDAFCRDNGVYKSNLLTAAYSYLLAKFNNEKESLFVTVYNGRTDKRMSRMAGMVVKTLPVYGRFDDDTTVLEFLKALQDQMSGCRKHDVYNFSDMMTDLELQVNSTFAWHGNIFGDTQWAGYPLTTVRIGNSTLAYSLYLKAFLLDGRFHVKAEYNSNEYSAELVGSLLESYESVLAGMLECERLSDIGLSTSSQLALLDTFNETEIDYDATQTVVSMFRRQAAATPDSVAVVYKDHVYTYADVDRISDNIAADIAARGLANEDVVSVLIPRCEWMAIASLGVLKAGCAYQPLDPTYPAERLNFMMKDASARLLIADEELRPVVNEYEGDVLLTCDILSLPTLPAPEVEISPESLMVLLYTSGSTGVPKGCQLVHRNLVAFAHAYYRYYNLKPTDRIGAYASYGFDACTMELYPALTKGAQVHIIPEELRLDLIELNKYLEANGITNLFMTTQVAYQFATSIDNHSLNHLLTGGEKLASLEPPKNFKVHNGYGPTETTVYITSHTLEQKLKEIPIGKAMYNVKLYVVDAKGHRLPVGASGELWACGPQVSRGYLNRPDKTAEVYIPNPFCDDPRYSTIYRTGDVVRYLPDGSLQFVGRRDGQVKIRGFRIEMKEVEAVIREFPGIKDATVQAFDAAAGGKFIAAYVVSDSEVDIEAMNQFILDRKPPYMVPAVTMQIDAIPLNQNMKVNKRALPKPEKKADSSETAVAAPMNVLEKELHTLVAEIVGTTDFNVTTPLGYAGLTSISSIRLAVQVNKRYGVALDSKSLVKTGTLQTIENEILSQLLAGGATAAAEDKPKEDRLSGPLSHAQTGVYFECLKNPTSTIYNIPYLLSYPEGVEARQLASAVKAVAECHPELMVHFTTEGDHIVQKITEDLMVEVPMSVMSDDELDRYKNEFVRPFNLQKAPLYRFEVVTTPSGVHLLMDIHHLLFDGGSADLFIRQLSAALEGNKPEKEAYSYLDFVADQQEAQESDAFRAAEQFFAERLQTCEGASEIPSDLPKTDAQGFIGEAVCPVNHDEVSSFCREREVTPAHLYLAATAYVVSRYTNNRDVYLCTVSSGRSNLRIADTVGMFVNTLALGLNVGDTSAMDYVKAVSATFDETLRHEDYPFARIASDYGFRPAIAYAYQVGVLSEYTVGGHTIGQELLELNVPKFKINIKIENRGVVVQYDDSLYSEAMADSLSQSIVAVANAILAAPDERIRKFSIVSSQQESALESLRQVATGDAPLPLFHQCISHYAAEQPEHEALVAVDARYTYAEMDAVTTRIASALQAHGVQARDRVALLLPRTSRLILSLFGVLKAGAAYIPCDPDYPADRVKLILEDSEARFIITTADRMESLPAGKAIDVETLVDSNAEYRRPDITPDDLAYLIYTSGSTGRPKGVMLRHEGICNYLYGHPANVFAHAVKTDATRVLSVTTISFDAALQDIGMAMYNGKTLVVATEEQANNPLELSQLISDQRIDMVSGTPSRWLTWLTSDDFGKAIANIKIARAGGEKFSDQLLEQLSKTTTARIFNCYGPTEITVASNNKELHAGQPVTVGRPQLNVKEFVVDSDGNELPVGVVGELYIGGRGVARGYNNLDEMTRERFVEYHGERVYRSGDYARWLPDGDVVILGRTDHQIKLRGLRIELGEIENVMLKVDGMKKVVIMIRKIGGKEHLCAYYTAEREIAPDALKAEISKSLTQYMVPTAYLQLAEMPMTPNGKTDVKALPEPQLAVSSAYEEPVNDTERAFCDIFAEILQMDRVGATDNFFELGGTSLVVTRVIIEADKAGIHVAYGDVFANPTPRQLARLVTGDSAESGDDSTTQYDYTAIDNLLRGNTLAAYRRGSLRELGDVLVTGATGYLGIHILRDLIDSDAGQIYCLVRGKTVEAAERRLKTLLFYYFAESFADLFGSRLHVVLGDVTSDFSQGLKVDTVFNCAAIVKHFSKGTEIEDVNIGGA